MSNARRNSSNPPATDDSSRASTVPSRTSLLDKDTLVVGDGAEDARGPLGLNLLYSPSEPLIDFIFVHGLNGGSRKTWSHTKSVTHFWPQEWLPRDPSFKNVRLYSFGYNSNWAKGKNNAWNIHEFGKLLLGELSTSPYLGDGDVRSDPVQEEHTSGDTNSGTLTDSDSAYRA